MSRRRKTMNLEFLITLFTVLIAENAVFAMLYGTDELERLTDDGRKMLIFGTFFLSSTVISDIIVVLIGCFVLPNPRDTLIIIIPTVSFSVTCGTAFAISKLKPTLYAELKPFVPVFGVNTASAGIIYESAFGVTSFSNAVFAALLSVVGALGAAAIFIGINERIVKSKLPSPMREVPVILVAAGIVAMILTGFSDMRF